MDFGLAYQTYCEYYDSGPPGEVDLEAPCFVCWYDISSPGRKCIGSHRDDIPKIGIHDLCAELPSEMEDHPFHSQHTLTLRTITSCDSGTTLCDACGRFISWGFYFCCEMCDFHLDPHCATLLTRYDTQYGIEFLEHPHQLMHCWNRGQASNLCCSGCKEPFGMDIYVCLDCHCLLDRCCADMPSRIRHPFHSQNPLTLDKSWAKWAHPFHPNHPLTLLVKHYPDSSRCNACGKELEGLIFYCSECEFGLDLVCAALMPAPVNHLQLGHPHRLTLCEKNETFNFTCYACQLRIKDSFCVCWECHIFLHRSCANLPWIVHRLPHQKHSSHPFKVPEKKHSSHCQHHTLTLLLDHLPRKQFVYVLEMHPLHPKYNGDIVRQAVGPTQPHKRNVHSQCPECSRLTTGFAYACSECSDYFSISCTLKKSLPHKQPLAYFNIKSNKLKCESCRRSLLTPFFRCEECNFNIHVSCISILPQIVKHRCHRHILSLTYSPVKDFPDEDENAELYCDICEEHRYLLDPTYYCEECHFVSHVHCVIETSEEMKALVEEWTLPFKLESQKNADKQKPPALKSIASVDEATGVLVEECEAEGSRVAKNRLSIIKQDEEIVLLREEILCLETKLSAMNERKKELETTRASNFRLTRT